MPGRKLLVAATSGHGFITNEDDAVAMTKNGKRVMNVKPGVEAAVCRPAGGDHVAVVGENRKLLIFKIDEVPEMGRGQGVFLQRYKDGGLVDAVAFTWKAGLKDENGRVFALRTQGLAGRARPGGADRAARLGQIRKIRALIFRAGAQAWPVNSQRMMMMGKGMPIAQSKSERMNSPRALKQRSDRALRG